MRNRPRPTNRPTARWRPAVQPPLPHPSWSTPVESGSVTAQEFWRRLGL